MKKYLFVLLIAHGLIDTAYAGSHLRFKVNDTLPPPVLLIKEMDENGNSVALKPIYKVVDPNSKLAVAIDIRALKNFIGDSLSMSITKKLGRLNAMLAAEKKSLENVALSLKAYNGGEPPSVWKEYLAAQADLTRLIFGDLESHTLFNIVHKRNDRSIMGNYSDLFKTAGILVKRLQDSIQSEARSKGIFILLGAWLDTKQSSNPIHIPGFDTYSSQPVYNVERFQVALTDEQKTQLAALTAFSDNANKNGLTTAVKTASAGLLQAIVERLKKLPSFVLADSAWNQFKRLKDEPTQMAGTLKTSLQEAFLAIDNYRSLVQLILNKYSADSFSITDVAQQLKEIATDIEQLLDETEKTDTELKTDITAINNASNTASGTLQTQIHLIVKNIDTLGTQVKKDLTELKTSTADYINNFSHLSP